MYLVNYHYLANETFYFHQKLIRMRHVNMIIYHFYITDKTVMAYNNKSTRTFKRYLSVPLGTRCQGNYFRRHP